MRKQHVILFVCVLSILLSLHLSSAITAQATEKPGELPPFPHNLNFSLLLPVVQRSLEPPTTPLQWAIDNRDYNNTYRVSWQAVENGEVYSVQEATNDQFTDGQIIYDNTGFTWDTPTGKTPGIYYYRVRAWNKSGYSPWSNTQYVIIHPLHVGLTMRWDGEGFIRIDESINVGTHFEQSVTKLTEEDTGQIDSRYWYFPNPEGWEEEIFNSFYRLSTGKFLSSSSVYDSDWKWYNPWFLSYNYVPDLNQPAYIDGQPFTVTGPHAGTTAFGKSYTYWKFVNQQAFLYHDSGGPWKQWVLPGHAVLRYDAGSTRLRTYSDVRRTYFYEGEITPYTIRYVDQLTAASSFGMAVTKTTAEEQTDSLPAPTGLPSSVPSPYAHRMHP